MAIKDYFFKVKTPSEVQKIIKELVKPLSSETMNIQDSLDRVLAEDITSPIDLPGFNRSTMDGFAVKAKDTFGTSAGSPAYLNLLGEIKMGEIASMSITDGEAIRVSTGSMIPQGADAVVMIEYTELLDNKTIEITRHVAPGNNIIKCDEDIAKGDIILHKGHTLRPQDIGALAGIGILQINVVKKPKIAIISSGDEIIPPEQAPNLGQIRDINSYSLSALAVKYGGIPINIGIVKDDYQMLSEKMMQSLEVAQITIISGGSSVGTRDITIDVIRSLNNAEVLVHGVSIKPGKPTIFAKVGDKYVFGLPGNPVSVMVTFNLFVGYMIKLLSGAEPKLWEPLSVKAKLNRNISSTPGTEEYICTTLIKSDDKIIAEPILGKSAMISMMVKADGLIKIPQDVEGLEAGTEVDVFIF